MVVMPGTKSGRTFFVTGASGSFGRTAIEQLRARGEHVIAGAREPAKVDDLAALGIEVRACDYDRPDTLVAALSGVDRVLLVSSSEVGRRVPQHEAVISAALAQGCEHFAYTSILHGLESPLALAAEHQATEWLIAASGLRHTILRNAWYSDNFELHLASAMQRGAIVTAAGIGRFSTALRSELAAGAVARIVSNDLPAAEALELAGSESFSMPELAEAFAVKLGKPVDCVQMAEADYADMLEGLGLPAPFAKILADSEAKAEAGAHFDDTRTLQRLIGRPPLNVLQLVDTWLSGANAEQKIENAVEG